MHHGPEGSWTIPTGLSWLSVPAYRLGWVEDDADFVFSLVAAAERLLHKTPASDN
jgi:hypothetical protein